MDPYDHGPFLGPLHAVLEIDWQQLTQLPPDRRQYAVRFPALPTHARLAGLSFGERFEAFAQKASTTWTATAKLDGGSLITLGVGASNPPAKKLPMGQLHAPFYFGMPIGDETFELSIEVRGLALPAVVTGTSLPRVKVDIEGSGLTLATNDRGPFVVRIDPGTYTPAQVVALIEAQTNADPAASLNESNELVLTSWNKGATSSVTIVDGTALSTLGLSPGVTTGSVGGAGSTPATPATVTGTVDLTTLGRGSLDGLSFTFKTDDRGPFTVTFGTLSAAPTTAGDVVAAIAAATNTDPIVSLSASDQIVLTSQSTGSQAYVEISSTSVGEVSLASLLGLPTGYTYGTDGGALPAEVTGTANLDKLTSPISGSLTLSTDDRAPFKVTFDSSATSAAAVVTAINNTDPVASLSTSGSPLHALVLTSANAGPTSSVTIVDGTALSTLGLSPGVTTGKVGGAGPTRAAVTGTEELKRLTYKPNGGSLNGLSFTFKTDDRGPFSVTFGTGSSAPTSPEDVVAAIAAATNTDPVASVDGNGHLVLQSRSKGPKATLSISGSSATSLGLPVTPPESPITGTAAPGLSAATAGHIDAHLFYFVGRGCP